jgi:soluble lytic murein transglycosylase-like protein
MRAALIIISIALAQAALAKPNPESLIKLQVSSLDTQLADTAHKHEVKDVAEALWLEKKERELLVLMARSDAVAARLNNPRLRRELLQTIYYEAKRTGLDPDLVLAIIRVESNFRKYAISSAGAQGLMLTMPLWAGIVGVKSKDLFNLRTNLRLGCAILRGYLDMEHGNVHRALARYNGSLGKNGYPNLIYAAWL